MFRNTGIILRLALPSIATFATMTLTGMISLLFVGGLGANAIAIVGVSNIIMYNAYALFSGIGHTINYLVAQNYGSQTMDQGLVRTFHGLYISLVSAVLVICIGFFCSEWILRALGLEEILIAQGTDYLILRFCAFALSMFVLLFSGFLRGIGDTKTPMVVSVISSLLLIFLIYSLTYGHFGFKAYGLIGAGWAMFFSELLAVLIFLWIFFGKLNRRFPTRQKAGWYPKEGRLVLCESMKLGGQEFAMSLSMIVFTMYIAVLGTKALAANEIALNILSLGFMPSMGFASTATILVGQEIGREQHEKAKRLGSEVAFLGILFLVCFGIVMFVFSDTIAKLYSDDPEVYLTAARLIKIASFFQLFDAAFIIYSGGLRGIGDTSFLLKASLAASWLYFIPATYLFTIYLGYGEVGAWIALYTYLTLLAILMIARYYLFPWQRAVRKQA